MIYAPPKKAEKRIRKSSRGYSKIGSNKMSTQQQETTAPAQQIEDFGSMNATESGYNRFTVTNRESGGVYQVRLGGTEGVECECGDYTYNRDEENQACKHILYANYQADTTMDPERWAFQQLAGISSDLRAAVDRLEAAETGTDTAEWDDNAERKIESTFGVSDAKDALRTAFEADTDLTLRNDIGVETYEGTDQLTFDAQSDDFAYLKSVTSKCDFVGYNGKRNTIPILDVPEYVEEVLS